MSKQMKLIMEGFRDFVDSISPFGDDKEDTSAQPEESELDSAIEAGYQKALQSAKSRISQTDFEFKTYSSNNDANYEEKSLNKLKDMVTQDIEMIYPLAKEQIKQLIIKTPSWVKSLPSNIASDNSQYDIFIDELVKIVMTAKTLKDPSVSEENKMIIIKKIQFLIAMLGNTIFGEVFKLPNMAPWIELNAKGAPRLFNKFYNKFPKI